MTEISIIIPIYNTGNFLKKCLDSVLNQTFKNIEVILINDGSTDNSGDICDNYAKKDSRVKVIHKQNEGVSVARNTGIQTATGEYIGFIDSDDWIAPDMYEKMYNNAIETKSYIVMCDAVTKYDNKPDEEDTITQLNNSCILEKKEIYPSLLMEIAGSACRCIYKREILINNNIIFPVGIKFSEDRIFNILAMGYSQKISYIKEPYYFRYMRKGSAVNKYYENMINMVFRARECTMEAIDTAWNCDQKYKDMYENQTVALTFSAINNEFSKDSKKTFKEKYNNVKKICKNEEIRYTIKRAKKTDLRSKLIVYNRVFLLCVIAIISNKKHRR